MSQNLRRRIAGLSIVFLLAQIVMPGFAFAANPSLTATLTQANVPAGAEIVSVTVPHDLHPGDSLVYAMSGTTVTQAFDTSSLVTLGLLNVKIDALPEVNSTVDTATRTYTITSAVPGTPFPTPTIVVHDAPNSASTLVNNVVAVAQEAEYLVPASLIAGDVISLTVAGTGMTENFATSKTATLTSLAAQISSGTTVDASYSGATNKLSFIAKTPGVAFSLSNLVIQSSGVAPVTVQPNVVPVAQVNTITLPRTIDAGEQLAVTVAGTPILQSYTGSSDNTLDEFTTQIDSLAEVNATRSGNVITITASVPGTPFTLGNLAVTGNSVAVVHIAPNIVAVAQVDALSFGRDFVVGDTLSGSVNGSLISVGYTTSSTGTLAAVMSAIDDLPGISATKNDVLRTITITADAPGVPFTMGTFSLRTQVTNTSITANVVAKAQSESLTFARNLVAGDTASVVINGTTVSQSFTGGTSNATLTALTAAIDGLAGVDASVLLVTRTITITSSTPGVSLSVSTLSVLNQLSPTVLQNPANPVKQVSSYGIHNTFISGDQISWTLAGQNLTGAFATDDASTLASVASTSDALATVDAVSDSGARTVTVTAATAGTPFTAGNLTTTSAPVSATSITTNQAETKAALTLSVVTAPLEGETVTIGDCVVTFSTGASDYDCSDSAASISIVPTDTPTIAALLRGLSGLGDPVNGSLVSSGTGSTAIFTRQTAQIGTTAINFVDATTPGSLTSSVNTPTVATTQSDSYTFPRTLVDGDTVTVTIDGTLFTQTFLADSDTTISNLATNIASLPQLAASASGNVLTVSAQSAGSGYTTGNLVITNVVVPGQSISSSEGAVAKQSISFPAGFVAGDAISVDINGTTVDTPYSTDDLTTLLNLASNISSQPGVSATASGSDTLLINATATGASLVAGTVRVNNNATPTTLQSNVVAVAQVDDFTLPYNLSPSQTVTATLSGVISTKAYTTDTDTTMTLLGGLIDNSTSASASYSGSTKTLRLTAKQAGVGYSVNVQLDGESISPVNLTPNTASGAQIDQFVVPRSLVTGETISLTLNGTGITTNFATDTTTTLANLAAQIDALPGVSAVSGATTVTISAEVAGIPFTLSPLAIAMNVPNTNTVANVPAQTQIMQVTVPRNLVDGDTLSITVGSGTVTQAYTGSEAATMSGLVNAIDALPGVSATGSALTVTVSAEVAGIPFTLGNLSLVNTQSPTTTVNNVSPVAQVSAVDVPTFIAGDTASITVNATTITTPFASDSTTTLASMRSAIDGIGAVTTSMSGSTLILTANVPGTPFTLSSLSVNNTQTATIVAVNVPPVSQIVTVTPADVHKKWTFRVTINGTNYDYLSTALDTDTSVVTSLANAITASGVTATASGSNLELTANIPGTAFTYSAVALDLTAPAITDVVSATEILKTGSTSTTSLSLDEDGSIYFVQSGSVVTSTSDLTALLSGGQAFLGKANALDGVAYTFTVPAGILDGAYRAIAIDAANNISALHTTGITIDDTPPALVINTPSGQTTNAANVTISGSTEPLLSVTMSNTGATVPLTALGDGSFTGNIALVLNTANTVTITATDAAGNISTRFFTITQDNINPVVSVTPASTVTNQSAVGFTGTTEKDSTVVITGGSGSLTISSDSLGDFSGSVVLTPNSLNNLLVTVTDAAGNVGTGSMNILQDDIAPAVALATASGAIVDANTYQIDGTTEALANVVITNQSGSTVGTATASATGSFSINATLVQDTVNVLTVTATDAATNSGSSALTITEDSVANTLLISPLPAATSSASITLTGSTKVGSTLSLVRSGGLTLTGSASTGDYSFTVPLALNSNNTIDLTSTDAAGHVATGSTSIVHDDVNPTVTIGTATQTVSSSTITLTGSTEALASVVVTGGSGATVGGTADGSGAFSLVVPLTTGAANILTVTATDIAGNTGSASVTITQDPIPLTLTLATSGPLTTSAATFTLTGSSKVGVNIAVTGSATASTTTNGSGSFSVTLPLTANVINTFLVTATSLGDTLTGSLVVIQDSLAPVFTVSATGALTNTLTYTLTGTTESGATITASGATSATASGTGAYSLTLPLVANSANSFVLTATDTAGNTSTGTTVVIAQDNIAPIVSTQTFSGLTSGSVTTGLYSFTTNETSTSTFYVGMGTNVTATQIWSGSTVGTTHSGSIVGVNPTNTYYVFVHSVDQAGNATDTPVSPALFYVNSGSSGGGGGGGGGGGSSGAPVPVPAPTATSSTSTTTSSGTTSTDSTQTGSVKTPPKATRPGVPPTNTNTQDVSQIRTPNIPRDRTKPNSSTTPSTPIGSATDTPNGGYVVLNPNAPTGSMNSGTSTTNSLDNLFEGGARFVSAANSVNVRFAPSAGAGLLAILPRNSRVELISADGAWGQVAFDGVTGWIKMEFLRTLQDSDIARNDPYLFEQGHKRYYDVVWATVTAERYLNVRLNPNGDSRVLRSLVHGEAVAILDRLNGSEWVEIRSAKGTGFVRKKFLKESN